MSETNCIMQRCEYLRALLPSDLHFSFFLHIPKTAGTHLSRVLQESNQFNLFSLDAPEEDFNIQREWFTMDRPTIIRAHIFWKHAWSNLLQYFPNSKPFSVVRSPYAVHFSMASMILERLTINHDPQAEYCRWLIGPTPDNFNSMDPMKQVAHVIRSSNYQSEYGDIYSKYLSFAKGIHPSPLDRCQFVPIKRINQVLEFECNYISDKTIYNQTSLSRLFNATDLLNSGSLEAIHNVVSSGEMALWAKISTLAEQQDCTQLLRPSISPIPD